MDLEDVSKYPNLFAELLRQGWNENDLEKLAGKNLLRVMRRVEQVLGCVIYSLDRLWNQSFLFHSD